MNNLAKLFIWVCVILLENAYAKKELKMAIVDEKKAPLVAMLNMTDVSENIQAYVDEAISNSVSALIEEKTKQIITSQNQAKVNSSENSQKLDIEDVVEEVEIMSIKMEHLKKKLNKCSEKKEKTCSNTAEKTLPIAFTAILSRSVTLGDEQIIKYDKVITNLGNAYHPGTGVFLVPVTGIYSVSVTMMGDPANSIHIQLMRNGDEVVRLYTQSGRYEMSAQTISIQLRKNDRLWVQRRTGTGSKIYGSENYNVFSGILMHTV